MPYKRQFFLKKVLYIYKEKYRNTSMNIAIRKLALLEKAIEEQEERSRLDGYTTSPIDPEFKQRVSDLMLKVKFVI